MLYRRKFGMSSGTGGDFAAARRFRPAEANGGLATPDLWRKRGERDGGDAWVPPPGVPDVRWKEGLADLAVRGCQNGNSA